MNSEIKFWEAVILSNKKIEPKNKSQEALYDIAEYYIQKERGKLAA